jgi:hypothetical protein
MVYAHTQNYSTPFFHREVQNLTSVCTETLVYTQNTQSSFLVYTHTHTHLTGPCIIVHLYNKDQQDALFTLSCILINNLYMFLAGLLLIIRRYYSVYT